MIGRTRVLIKRPLARALVAALAIALITLVIWGFLAGRRETGEEAQGESPVKTPSRVSTRNGAAILTLDRETEQRNGIEIGTPPHTSYQVQVSAYAMVLDPARLTELNNSYLSAKSQRDATKAKLAASKMAYQRARGLYKDQQNVSLAQLQAAEATFLADQSSLAAAQTQLQTLADTAQQEWGAALAQSIVHRSLLVRELIDRTQSLVQVTLPPGTTLQTPPVTASLLMNAGARRTITFVSPATRTDPKIQGISFYYAAPASSALLTGMSLQALLPSGASTQGIAVPASAIVWWQDRAWVYRRLEQHVLMRTEIPTDHSLPGGGFMVANLPEQSSIVIRGAQVLLSEEFRAQIQAGD